MSKAYYFPQRQVIEFRTGNLSEEAYPLPDSLLNEDAAWLQIEAIDDGQGNLVNTVTVNQVLKEQIMQQRLDDDLARQEAEEAEKARKKEKEDKIKNFNPNQVNNLNDIRQSLLDVIEFLKEYHGF